MSTLRGVVGTMYQAYIYKTLYRDVSRFLKRTLSDIDLDLDKKALLNKVGLTPYTPVKKTIGGLSFFLLGAAIGTAIGVVMAPKPGVELRQEVKEKAMDLLGRTNEAPIDRRVHA
jgi:hypothetical protein